MSSTQHVSSVAAAVKLVQDGAADVTLRKLGVSNRAQAAALAERADLTAEHHT
jgi:hypothetical protein